MSTVSVRFRFTIHSKEPWHVAFNLERQLINKYGNIKFDVPATLQEGIVIVSQKSAGFLTFIDFLSSGSSANIYWPYVLFFSNHPVWRSSYLVVTVAKSKIRKKTVNCPNSNVPSPVRQPYLWNDDSCRNYVIILTPHEDSPFWGHPCIILRIPGPLASLLWNVSVLPRQGSRCVGRLSSSYLPRRYSVSRLPVIFSYHLARWLLDF